MTAELDLQVLQVLQVLQDLTKIFKTRRKRGKMDAEFHLQRSQLYQSNQ